MTTDIWLTWLKNCNEKLVPRADLLITYLSAEASGDRIRVRARASTTGLSKVILHDL